MTNYVLVHGGDRDGTIWSEVATLLEAQGHQVYCPSMQSVTKVSLEHNINEIIELIESNNLSDIILCGHSYGAMVITGVYDKIPEKISLLVFIDSMIPESGNSLYGLLAKRGINYQDFGLTPDRACLDELSFNAKKFSAMKKVYLHCLQSEFHRLVKPIYNELLSKGETERWITFCLDTTHSCMLTQPKEVAVILSGLRAV